MVEQTTSVDNKTKALCFTALSSSSGVAGAKANRGVCIWGTQTKAADPSGIEDINAEEPDDAASAVYDLFGRKQDKLHNGLNVRNGKVIFVK